MTKAKNGKKQEKSELCKWDQCNFEYTTCKFCMSEIFVLNEHFIWKHIHNECLSKAEGFDIHINLDMH